MQNRTLAALSAPHAGQRGASEAPQPPQKRAAVGLVCPQLAQAMATWSVARPAGAPPEGLAALQEQVLVIAPAVEDSEQSRVHILLTLARLLRGGLAS